MAAPLKIAARVEIDANPAKQGAVESTTAVDSIGAAAERNATKLQQLINATTGIGRGPANQNMREWSGALALQGRSLDELRAKYNPLYATINQYKAALTEIRTLHAQGVLSTNEMTAAIQRQRQAALASIDVIKGRSAALRAEAVNSNIAGGRTGNQHVTQNAMFQFQDIVMTSAMGMNPGMIGMQQGTQLAGAFFGMGLKEAATTTGAAIAAMINPLSLTVMGLTTASAAAIQYFMRSTDEAETSSRAIERHGELIKRLKEAYGDASVGLKEYSEESKKLLQQDAADSIRDYRKILSGSASDLLSGVLSVPVNEFNGKTFIIGQMQGAVATLQDTVKAGRPDVQAFVEKLIEIENHPAVPERIREMAQELRETAKQGIEAQRALGPLLELERNRAARQRGFVIGSSEEAGRLDYLDRQRLSLRRMRLDAEAQESSLFARSPADRAAAARQAEAARSISGESAEERELRIGLAGRTTLVRAEKELAYAGRARSLALESTMAQQQLELSLIDQTVGEQERLRMEHRLTAELKAEAARMGTAIDEAELARVKALSAEYGRLAEQMAARRALTSQDHELAALRTRLAVASQSEEVRARVIVHLETERRLRELGLSLGSREAEQYRRNAEAIADATEQLRKQDAAWAKVRGTAESTIDSIFDKAIDGDFGGLLEDIAKDWSKTILTLGAANPLKNGLLGTNHETLNDIGGLKGMFSRLFGGAGMSTASMSVNAATVSINGGIASGIGGLLVGANDNFKPNTTLGALLGAGGAASGNLAGAGGALSFIGNYKSGVDSRLTDILDTAARQFPGYKVDAISGFRPGDPRFHGKGLATDIQLTDLASGRLLGNYQDASSFSTYERFAQTARAVQMAKYPELADQFRWGGYFSGGKGKYGALDTMHFDLAGAGMGGGSWENGLTSAQRSLWSGIESKGTAAVSALNKLAGQSDVAASGLGSLGNGLDKFGSALGSVQPGGGTGGGGGGGILSSLIGLFSPQYRIASSGGIGLYAKGGIADRPSIFGEAGAEAAVPLPDGRTIPVTLNVRQAYRHVGHAGMQVSSARNAPIINNYGNTAVAYEESTDEHGNRQPIITIGEPVAAAVRQRGNPTRQALQSEFGLRPRRIAR